METYTLPYGKQMPVGICCVTQGAQPSFSVTPRGVGWGGRWREVQEGRDICILWLIHIDVWQKHNIVAIKNKSQEKKQIIS